MILALHSYMTQKVLPEKYIKTILKKFSMWDGLPHTVSKVMNILRKKEYGAP